MKYIPFNKISVPKTLIEDLSRVIKSGWITTGKQVQLLESSISSIIGTKNVVAVSSCTAAPRRE